MPSEQLKLRDPDRAGDWDEIKRGEFAYGQGPLGSARSGQQFFIFWRSADNHPVCIPVNRGTKVDNAWLLSGPEESPTLHPSVFVSPPTGWHGWIRDGRADDA